MGVGAVGRTEAIIPGAAIGARKKLRMNEPLIGLEPLLLLIPGQPPKSCQIQAKCRTLLQWGFVLWLDRLGARGVSALRARLDSLHRNIAAIQNSEDSHVQTPEITKLLTYVKGREDNRNLGVSI